MLPMKRTVAVPTLERPSGVEISESKLTEMIASVQAAGDDLGPLRRAIRVPVEGFARIQPLGTNQQRVVGVYDMSRTGIAIVDSEPMNAGEQFNVLFSRADKRPIEVLCTTRHSRRQGEAFIIGAEFGVSWLSAMSAAMM